LLQIVSDERLQRRVAVLLEPTLDEVCAAVTVRRDVVTRTLSGGPMESLGVGERSRWAGCLGLSGVVSVVVGAVGVVVA
jgi:hypothetical protein